MIILISGASHTGKTLLAQKLLEKHKYPCFSVDHLKMGLIRSNNTDLTPLSSDKELTNYLWPIVREIVKTALENNQNLIIEGCYIPHDFERDFNEEQLKNIKHCCLAFSEEYIKNNFGKIKSFANVIENRICDDITLEETLTANREIIKNNKNVWLIDKEYKLPLGL